MKTKETRKGRNWKWTAKSSHGWGRNRSRGRRWRCVGKTAEGYSIYLIVASPRLTWKQRGRSKKSANFPPCLLPSLFPRVRRILVTEGKCLGARLIALFLRQLSDTSNWHVPSARAISRWMRWGVPVGAFINFHEFVHDWDQHLYEKFN